MAPDTSTLRCRCGCGGVLRAAKYRSQQPLWLRGHNRASFDDGAVIKRFWSRVSKTPTCWLWTGSVRHFGHGHMNVRGRRQLAHRLSWVLAFGEVPDGMSVLHHCDVPRCVNPAHLYLGTQADNVRDMVARGRHTAQRTKEARP